MAVIHEDKAITPATARRYGDLETTLRLWCRLPMDARFLAFGSFRVGASIIVRASGLRRHSCSTTNVAARMRPAMTASRLSAPYERASTLDSSPPHRGPERGPGRHQPEQPLGLPRRDHVVGQGPHLGGCHHPEDAHPDVHDGVEPPRGRAASECGEDEAGRPEEQEASLKDGAEAGPCADANVGGDGHRHHDEDRDVGVGKLLGFEAVQEECISRHPPDLIGADDEEEIGDEKKAAGEVPALKRKGSLEAIEYQMAPVGRLIKPEGASSVHTRLGSGGSRE